MKQDEYIKQLEESNRNLQDKLEESEKKHDDFLDKPVYIYMDGKSRSFDNLSFTDKKGGMPGEMRIVTSMRYIQQDDRMFGDDECSMYEQMWEVDQSGNHKWMTTPNIKLNISSVSIKAKTRKLKMKWTVDAIDDLKNIGNNGAIDFADIVEEEMRKEVEKFTKPIKKPTAKEIKKYGRKKNAK
jgi:hypothetical protein